MTYIVDLCKAYILIPYADHPISVKPIPDLAGSDAAQTKIMIGCDLPTGHDGPHQHRIGNKIYEQEQT